MFKRLIRYLYWRYVHEGSPWQADLICFHIGKLRKEDGTIPEGRYILAQIEEIMIDRNIQTNLKEIAGFHIGEL